MLHFIGRKYTHLLRLRQRYGLRRARNTVTGRAIIEEFDSLALLILTLRTRDKNLLSRLRLIPRQYHFRVHLCSLTKKNFFFN